MNVLVSRCWSGTLIHVNQICYSHLCTVYSCCDEVALGQEFDFVSVCRLFFTTRTISINQPHIFFRPVLTKRKLSELFTTTALFLNKATPAETIRSPCTSQESFFWQPDGSPKTEFLSWKLDTNLTWTMLAEYTCVLNCNLFTTCRERNKEALFTAACSAVKQRSFFLPWQNSAKYE